MNKIHRLGMMV